MFYLLFKINSQYALLVKEDISEWEKERISNNSLLEIKQSFA